MHYGWRHAQRYAARTWERLLGVAPTGKAIEITHISLDQVAQGKVVEHFGVSDWLRALTAFEIVPAPTALTSEAKR